MAAAPQKGQNARDRAATEMLSNQRFAYLVNPHKATNSGNSIEVGGDLASEMSGAAKADPGDHGLHMDFSANQKTQMAALTKEVEWLKKEVPHFASLHSESTAVFAHDKAAKKKTETETASFALIQSLTAWVHEYGRTAVNEYEEFKQAAENEMTNMVGKMEKMAHETKKLKLIVEQAEHEKDELEKELNDVKARLNKLESSESEMAERNRAMMLNQDELGQLQQELHDLKSAKKALSEKYERVQKYWKMTQDENDELRKKTSGFEGEIKKLRDSNVSVKQEMAELKRNHRKQMQQIEADQAAFAQQMRAEQEKLMESAHAAMGDNNMGDQQAARMEMGDSHDSENDDDNGSFSGSESGSDHLGRVMSLGDDVDDVYEYEDDDWLDDEESSEYSEDMDHEETPEPVKEKTPTPPPKEPTPEPVNQQDFFETEKTSDHLDLVFQDKSLTFKMESIGAGQEETRQQSSRKVEVQAAPVVAAPVVQAPVEPEIKIFMKDKHLSFEQEETREIKRSQEDYAMKKGGLRSKPHLFPIRVEDSKVNSEELELKVEKLELAMKEEEEKHKITLAELETELELEFQERKDMEGELEEKQKRVDELESQMEEAQSLVKAAQETIAALEAQLSAPKDPDDKQVSFESSKSGPMGQSNMMTHAGKVKTKTVVQTKYVERGAREKEMIMGGANFHERMAMFQNLAKTKGGKPGGNMRSKVLSQSKAYGIIAKLGTKRNLMIPDDDASDTSKGSKDPGKDKVSAAVNALSNMADADVSVVKTNNVLKITKCTAHLLKPRLYGYMNIVHSKFIPRWKQSQNPRYFFVLDGLPSETNTNRNEPEFAKNRKHDHLVPTLCFFADKEQYDEFYAKIKDTPTRTIKFQKLFADYAKGTFPLSKYALDITTDNCTRRINVLLDKTNLVLPKTEVAKVEPLGDLDIMCVSDHEVHKFTCNDKVTRDKWVKKVNKLVDKRAKRLAEINSGLFGVVSGHKPKAHDHAVYDKDVEEAIDATRPTIVGGVPSMSKLNDVNKVEKGFD